MSGAVEGVLPDMGNASSDGPSSSASSDHLDPTPRAKILVKSKLIDAIKEVQVYESTFKPIKNKETSEKLVQAIEAMFLHGIKRHGILGRLMNNINPIGGGPTVGTALNGGGGNGITNQKRQKIPDVSFWHFVMIHSHKSVIAKIEGLSQIRTDVGKSRVWIREALNSGDLSSLLASIAKDKGTTRQHYNRNAILRDPETVEVFSRYILGLEGFKFELALNSSLLNKWQTPPLIMAGLYVPDGPLKEEAPPVAEDVAALMAAEEAEKRAVLGEADEVATDIVGSIDSTSRPIGFDYRPFQGLYQGQTLLNEDEAMKIILATGSRAESLSSSSPGATGVLHSKTEPSSEAESQRGGVRVRRLSVDSTSTNNRKLRRNTGVGSLMSAHKKEAGVSTTSMTSYETALSSTPPPPASSSSLLALQDGASSTLVTNKPENSQKDDCDTRKDNNDNGGLDGNNETDLNSTMESSFHEEDSIYTKYRRPSGQSNFDPPAKQDDEEDAGEFSQNIDKIIRDIQASTIEIARSRSESRHSPAVDRRSNSSSASSSSRSSRKSSFSIGDIRSRNQMRRERKESSNCSETSKILRAAAKKIADGGLSLTESPRVGHVSGFVQDWFPFQNESGRFFDDTPPPTPNSEEEVGFTIKPDTTIAGLTVRESTLMIGIYDRVTHEHGLDTQGFKCWDCKKAIGSLFGSFRTCEFTKRYYCDDCHTSNSYCVIPSKAVYNLDFQKKLVSVKSKRFLDAMAEEPVIDGRKAFTPEHFKVSKNLSEAVRLRKKLSFLYCYLFTCSRDSKKTYNRFLILLSTPGEHIYKQTHLWSVNDLESVHNGGLLEVMKLAVSLAEKHVRRCIICSGKGFICEVCKNPEPIYPFELEKISQCKKCFNVFHGECSSKLMTCPRCERKEARELNWHVTNAFVNKKIRQQQRSVAGGGGGTAGRRITEGENEDGEGEET